MKIRTIIVDDEAPARRRMRKLIMQNKELELVAEAESGSEAIAFINAKSPNLVLLDIELKDMTGFDVLKNISSRSKFKIIFITAYNEFAVKAFEENAVDYLLKPYRNDRFFEAISRAMEYVRTNEQQTLADLIRRLDPLNFGSNSLKVEEGKVIHYFDLTRILYIKSESYYCNFILEDDQSKIIRVSMKYVESVLPEYFVRIGRSIILNTRKIISIKALKKVYEIELVNKEQFSAYKTYNDLKAKISRFV